jgi:hypothetical protein
VTSAAWNREGSILLVASNTNSLIHVIHFTPSSQTLDDRVTLDVSPTELEGTDGRRYRVGGTVQSLVWSPNSDRLIVSFMGEEDGYVLFFVVWWLFFSFFFRVCVFGCNLFVLC